MNYNTASQQRTPYLIRYRARSPEYKLTSLDKAVLAAGTIPTNSKQILVSHNGKIYAKRIPQWYDPLTKLAAGGIITLGLYRAAAAQDQPKVQPSQEPPKAGQEQPKPEPQKPNPADFEREVVRLAGVAVNKAYDAHKLKTPDGDKQSLEQYLEAHFLYNKAEHADTKSEAYTPQINDTRNWVAYKKFGSEIKDLTPEQLQELTAFITEYNNKRVQQDAPKQPEPKQPEPQDPPKQDPPQDPAKKSSELILPGDARFLETLSATSYKSTQRRNNFVDLRTPWIDVLGQWHSEKDREAVTNDPRSEDGFGAHVRGKLNLSDDFGLEGGITFSNWTRDRKSSDRDVTFSPGFVITADTETLEEIEQSYKALMLKMKLGKLTPHLTLYDDLQKINVDSLTTLVVDNLTDPAGDYTQLIPSGTSFDVETKGAQFGLRRDWDNLVVGGIGGIERVEIGSDGSKFDIYRLDIYASLFDAPEGDRKSRWGISGGLGRRLTDDAEEASKFDKYHGYLNAAAKLGDSDITAFGSFWYLDNPAGGLGLVFGKGDAVRMLMDYRNAMAWEQMDLLKELGPEERKVYVNSLHYDFLRGLSLDKNMRLMLFGGARRNEIAGDEQVDWFAHGAFILPVTKDLTIAIDAMREKVGLEEIIEAGIQFEPWDGWRFRLSGGASRFEGRKHPDAEFMTIGVEKGF